MAWSADGASYRQRQRIEKAARALWASGAFGLFRGAFEDQPDYVKDEYRLRAVNAIDSRLVVVRRSGRMNDVLRSTSVAHTHEREERERER